MPRRLEVADKASAASKAWVGVVSQAWAEEDFREWEAKASGADRAATRSAAETPVEGVIPSAVVTAVRAGAIPLAAGTVVVIEVTTAEISHQELGDITDSQSMLHRNTSQVG